VDGVGPALAEALNQTPDGARHELKVVGDGSSRVADTPATENVLPHGEWQRP